MLDTAVPPIGRRRGCRLPTRETLCALAVFAQVDGDDGAPPGFAAERARQRVRTFITPYKAILALIVAVQQHDDRSFLW